MGLRKDVPDDALDAAILLGGVDAGVELLLEGESPPEDEIRAIKRAVDRREVVAPLVKVVGIDFAQGAALDSYASVLGLSRKPAVAWYGVIQHMETDVELRARMMKILETKP
jgi:hypothetical protein